MSEGGTVLAMVELRVVDKLKDSLAEKGAMFDELGARAEESGNHIGHFAASLAKATLAASALAVGIIAYTVKATSEFNDQMQVIAGNTGLSATAIENLKAQIISLAAQGPAPINDIANAFMHASNLGYTNADAMKVVKVAWEGAIATGGTVTATMNTLGTVMRDFNIPASGAAEAMQLVMTAAANGNITMTDMTQSFTRVGVVASSVHMPLADAVSGYSALTRATGDAALAQTLWVSMVQKIIDPTKQAQTLMAQLAKTTNVDLAGAFKSFSEGQTSFQNVMKLSKEATAGNSSEIFKLFGGIRGGMGALYLLGSGWQSYNNIVDTVNNHQIQLKEAFKAMQDQLESQLKTLGNNAQNLAISIGSVLVPSVEKLTQSLMPVVTAARNFTESHKTLTLALLEGGVAIGALTVAWTAFHKVFSLVGGVFGEIISVVKQFITVATGHQFAVEAETKAQVEQAAATGRASEANTAALGPLARLTEANNLAAASAERLAAANELVGKSGSIPLPSIGNEVAPVASDAATAGETVGAGASLETSAVQTTDKLKALAASGKDATTSIQGVEGAAAKAAPALADTGVAAATTGAAVEGVGVGAGETGAALLGLGLATGGVGIAVAALAAGTVVAYKNNEDFRTSLDNLNQGQLTQMVGMLGRVHDGMDALSAKSGPAGNAIGDFFSGVGGKAEQAGKKVKEFFKLVADGPDQPKKKAKASSFWTDNFGIDTGGLTDIVKAAGDLTVNAITLGNQGAIDDIEKKWSHIPENARKAADIAGVWGDNQNKVNLALQTTGDKIREATMAMKHGDSPDVQAGKDASFIGSAARDFSADQKQAKSDADSALAGFAQGLLNSSGISANALGALAEGAAQSSIALQKHTDALAKAAYDVAKINGDWVTVNKDESQKLKSNTDAATAALVHALATHAGNIQQLSKTAADATNKETDRAKVEAEAAKLIKDAGGETTAEFKKAAKAATELGAALSQAASKAFNALAAALDKGKGDIGSLTEKAILAAGGLSKYQEAVYKAAVLTGDWSQALATQKTILTKALGEATDKKSYDEQHGASRSVLTVDQQKIDAAQNALNDFTKATKSSTTETVANAVKQHDYGKAMDLMSAKLQATLKSAEGKLVVDTTDKASQGTITADQDSVVKAKNALNDFQKITSDVTNKAHLLGLSFSELQTQAQTKGQKTFDAFAAAIQANAGKIDPHMQHLADSAVAAKEGIDGLARSSAIASKYIEEHAAKPPVADYKKIGGWQSHLQGDYDKELAKVTDDLYNHRGNLKADEEALKTSKSALDRFAKSATDAAAAGSGKTFAVQESDAQKAANLAAQHLARGLYNGSDGLDKLKDKAIDTAKTVQAYADAHTKAAKIITDALMKAADAATRFAAEMANLQGSIDKHIGEAAGLKYDPKTGVDTSKTVLHAPDAGERVQNRQLQVNDNTGTAPVMTQYQHDIDTAASSLVKLDAATKVRTQTEIKVFEKAGEFDKALQGITGLLSGAYSNAIGAATIDIYKHGAATATDVAAIQQASDGNEKMAMAQKKAGDIALQASINSALKFGDFAKALSDISTKISGEMTDAMSKLTVDLLNHTGDVTADSVAVKKAAGDAEALALAQRDAAQIQTKAEIDAANAAGDFATAWDKAGQLLSSNLSKDVSDLSGALAAGVTNVQSYVDAYNRDKKAANDHADVTIRAARILGDFAGLGTALNAKLGSDFDAIGAAIENGTGDLNSLIASYNQDKAAVDAHTAAETKALFATGQYAAGWSAMMQTATNKLNDSTAKLAKSFYDTGTASEADIAAAQANNESLKKMTQAQWDAAYASGDAATKSQMLSQAFSGLISQASSVQSMQSSVDSAKLGVIAANSAIVVGQINAQTTAITDLAGILSAQKAVTTAEAQGRVTAINDQTTIMKDISAVQLATSPGTLKVAQDQLAIDRAQAVADQVNASWNKIIAMDNLKAAQTKMAVDMANAAAQAVVAMDHLNTAKIAVKVALDLQKLGTDQLVVLNAINSNLGGVEDFGNMIQSDLTQLGKDQADATAAALQEAIDTATANQTAAQGSQLEAMNQYQAARDATGQASASENSAIIIAHLQQILAQDEIANAQNAQSLKNEEAIIAQYTSLNETITRIRQLEEMGVDGMNRGFNVSKDSADSMLGTLGTQRQTNPSVGR